MWLSLIEVVLVTKPDLTANEKSTSVFVRLRHDDSTDMDIQDHWVKYLSDRDLTQPEKDVLAKGLNFVICPQHLSVVDLITAIESAIGITKSQK